MNRVLSPGPRTGRVTVPGSKSLAHRLFLPAALGRLPAGACQVTSLLPSPAWKPWARRWKA